MSGSTYVVGGSIINNGGIGLDKHWELIKDGQSLLKPFDPNVKYLGFSEKAYRTNQIDLYPSLSDLVTYVSALTSEQWANVSKKGCVTRAMALCVSALEDALTGLEIKLHSEKVLLILATTKGDIDLMTEKAIKNHEDLFLPNQLAKNLKDYFHLAHDPIVLSNACISGAQAIMLGKEYIDQGEFEHVIVCGVDLVTPFTLLGFHSFKALSATPCMPFDRNRSGLSLGEAGAVMILSRFQIGNAVDQPIVICDGYVTGDANHISAPSREAHGLSRGIQMAIENNVADIDVISLHGTATWFNDDMESVAVQKCDLQDVPVFGLKGIYGHTLGASGLIESLVLARAMQQSIIPGTVNCTQEGTVEHININKIPMDKKLKFGLKCASGFGGSNCVLLFRNLAL